MRIGAVILGAGFGTRLAPLTNNTPKPLLDVGGRPVASHLLDRLGEVAGLTQVVAVANGRHLDQWMAWAEHASEKAAVNVVQNGVVDEQDRRGAVSDLLLGVSALATNDWVIVLAGDNLLEEPLQPHVDSAVATKQPTVLCRDLGADVPAGRFGEITIDADDVITRFREKPANPTSPLAATCTYILPGDIGATIEDYLREGDADSPGTFIGWLAARRSVTARRLTGRYFDIGNHETLAAARSAFGNC